MINIVIYSIFYMVLRNLIIGYFSVLLMKTKTFINKNHRDIMVLEFLENGWEAYKKNFWRIIGSVIIYDVIVFGILFLMAFFIILPIFMGSKQGVSMPFTDKMGSPLNATQQNISQVVSRAVSQKFSSLFTGFNIVGLIIGGIIFLVAAVVLGAGLVGVYYEALKKKARIKTMFRVAKEKFWTIIGANLLVGLIGIGLVGLLVILPLVLIFVINGFLAGVLTIVGGVALILIMILLSLVNQAIVIDDKKAVESVKESYRVVKSNYFSFLILVIILTVLSSVVSLIPWVGWLVQGLFIVPLMGLTYTSFYLGKK